jgi:hypothetical protein
MHALVWIILKRKKVALLEKGIFGLNDDSNFVEPEIMYRSLNSIGLGTNF